MLIIFKDQQRKFAIILALITLLAGCSKEDQKCQGYVEGMNIYLAPVYSGRLIESFVERGQHVKKNQLLFKLESNPQQLVVKQNEALVKQSRDVFIDLSMPKRPAEIAVIKAQLDQAIAQLNLAVIRAHRNQTLYDKHAIDKDSVDASVERSRELSALKAQFEAELALAHEGSRKNQIKAQAAQLISLKAKLNQVKWELDQKMISAPDDGVIFDTYYLPGEYVESSRAIASLLTPDNIRIVFFVPAKSLATLAIGEKITFDCEGCAKNNEATIQYISPEAEYVPPLVYSRENSDKLVFRVRASIAHSQLFKPGQPVIVALPKHG